MTKNSKGEFRISELIKRQSNYPSWILENIADTMCFGEALICQLPEIKLLLLEGELGAGKTSIVKGLAQGLGINEPITSPTFALAQHYPNGHTPLIHLDLYRIEDSQLANELFLQEEEEAKSIKGIMAVEWSERLALDLPEAWIAKLKYTKNDKRTIQVIPPHNQ